MKKFLFIILYSLFVIPVLAASPDELRKSIEEKAKSLLEINNQIKETQGQLNQAQNQKNTLQSELKKIDYNINQLNLGIKSSQINIEKNSLELQNLQYEITEIKDAVATKKMALASLIRELYEKDREGQLISLLKNKSLAESLLESQSISKLNDGLSAEVKNLHKLNSELDSRFFETSAKKQKIETENQNLKNRRAIVEDQKSERQGLLVKTKNQEKAFASLLDNLAKQQAEISAEIEKIEEELRSKIDPSLLPLARPGVLLMPLKGTLSQEFGTTAFAKNGYRGGFHNGIDIAAPIGSEIVAAEGGKVIAMGDQDLYCRKGAYGKFIVVEHENNLTTLYAHLSRFAIQNGQAVSRGQLIGYVGRTGYATGPHLHLTVYASPTFYIGASRTCGPMPLGGYLNPLDYVGGQSL